MWCLAARRRMFRAGRASYDRGRPTHGNAEAGRDPLGAATQFQRIGAAARIMAKTTMDDARREPSARVGAI